MSEKPRCQNCDGDLSGVVIALDGPSDRPLDPRGPHYQRVHGGFGWTCPTAPWRDRALRAEGRIADLNALVVKIANETPYPDEAKDALAQRGKLVAEVGTLRNRISELEHERYILGIEIDGQKRMTNEAVRRWQEAERKLLIAESIGGVLRDRSDAVAAQLAELRAEVDRLRAEQDRLRALP